MASFGWSNLGNNWNKVTGAAGELKQAAGNTWNSLWGNKNPQPGVGPGGWSAPAATDYSWAGDAFKRDVMSATAARTSQGDREWMNSLNSQIRALQNQIAQTPKLPNFDIMANYNRAKGAAEAAVNPLYTKKLNDFLARQGQLRTRKQQEADITRGTIDTRLQQELEDTATGRARTSEDVAGALEQIGRGEERFQDQEGEQFDTAARDMAALVASSGLATSGLGRQQQANQVRERNRASGEQVEGFDIQRKAKELFKNRTFEDLAKTDVRAQLGATKQKEQVKFDLDAYLEDIAYEEQKGKFDIENERLRDVGQRSAEEAGAGVNQFIASLAGGGWRPQDIALAKQVYG